MRSAGGAGHQDVTDEALIGSPPPGFRRLVVRIPAGGALPYVPTDWAGALVTVAAGTVELCGGSGRRYRFATGAVLFLDGLGLRALHNPGACDAVLVALARETC